MIEQVRDGVRFYTSPLFEPWPQLTHAVFTRHGGVSEPPFDTLNLSYAVRDEAQCVAANLEAATRAVGWDASSIVSLRQVHGRDVVEAREDSLEGPLASADGLVTDRPGVLLMLKFADCVPVLMWDPVRGVAGIAHAGWRGTILGTPTAVVQKMKDRYGSDQADVRAVVGPSIGPCCYEVGAEVEAVAGQAFPRADVLSHPGGGKAHLDLWRANLENLLKAGLDPSNVEVSGICTSCRSDHFFSHRASGGRAGRFGAVIGIRDE